MEPISLLIVLIGFIGRPLAEKVRDRYIDDLVGLLPDLIGPAAGRLRQLVAGTVNGDNEARDTLHRELVADPRTAAALAEAVQAQTGNAIPSPADSPPASQRMRDFRSILLDGYQQALYNLTLTAVFAGRPVVVDAAFQGTDWLTACIPKFGSESDEIIGETIIRRETIPDPHRLWHFSDDPDLVEYGFGQPEKMGSRWPVTYHVRWIPDSEARAQELAEREEQFQYEPGTSLPPSEPNTPPQQRWLRIMNVRPKWVQLGPVDFEMPKGETDDLMEKLWPGSTKRGDFLNFSDYPDEWKPLIKIPKPPDGIRLVMDAADRLAASEESVRTAVQALVDRGRSGDGAPGLST